MSRPAQCVHRIRYQVPRLQACFNHCPSPSDHGCISHWIWSRDSLHDQITPPSSLSLMVFPRQPTLWRCLNCPLRWKPLCSSPSMFSALMEFLRGPWFTSQVWKKLCSELGAQVSLSSGFHPQTNGQVERANQELEAMLHCVASSNQSTWSEQLPWVEYGHNASTLTANGMTPFEASLGYLPPLLSITEGELAVPSVQHHVRRCRRVWHATRAALLRRAAQNKRLADRRHAPAPALRVGQKVWLSTKHIPLRTESKKLAPKFIGTFPIRMVLNPVTVRLALPRTI